MTSLRVFTCGPYGATLRPEACAQRFAPSRGRQSPGAGARVDRIHCHECPVGAAHARGEDAPGVEYSLVDVSAPRPVPRPPSHRESFSMPATTETRPTRPCAHPECDRSFVPSHSRSLYCNVHRTPEAAAARKALRDELERAAEATRAKTEPPAHAPTAAPVETVPAIHVGAVALVDADRWASSQELDEHELASAKANDEIVVDEKGLGWVSCRWLLGHRTRHLSRMRAIVSATKEAVGDLWTKDRPLAEAVTAKCAFLEADAQREHDGRLEAEKALSDARTTLLERGERIEVLQRELSAAETRAGYGDRVADRLNHAMLAIIEVETACRDDIDEDELDAEWAALDAEGVSQRARELVEYVRSLRAESQVAQVPLDRAMTVCVGGELDRAREAGVLELPTGLVPVRWLLAERAKQIAELAQALNDARAELSLEHAAAAEREAGEQPRPKTFVDAFVEAIAPPGVSAAAVLRAVGYQIVTVDSPRGPVIVVEGARG